MKNNIVSEFAIVGHPNEGKSCVVSTLTEDDSVGISPTPGENEQMVRYYGCYSNKSRGLRKKAGRDNEVPALIASDISRKNFRKFSPYTSTLFFLYKLNIFLLLALPQHHV